MADQDLQQGVLMKKLAAATALVLVLGLQAAVATSTSRLKDVASLRGVPSEPILGYGLVVGLNKTGDKRQTLFSAQSLANMLERFGVEVPADQMKVENVAAVLVTAELSPFAQLGARLDVTASSIGDARSLQGGTLLPTPLRRTDGSIVALAQGPLSIGGFGAGGGGSSVAVNHLTVGRVPNGGFVQVARQTALPALDSIAFALRDPDFMSARRVADAINMELGANQAIVEDAGTVVVTVPQESRSAIASFVARLEPIPVTIDQIARVAINERTGTVVLGGDVRIGPAAVAHGNLSVRIDTQYQVSQPESFSGGTTQVVPRTNVNVQETEAQLVELQSGTTLAEVVRALNALGATPRDIIAIMQALKAAGALQAEIVIL
jgi:flagellar P-ring protein precursor FlgI